MVFPVFLDSEITSNTFPILSFPVLFLESGASLFYYGYFIFLGDLLPKKLLLLLFILLMWSQELIWGSARTFRYCFIYYFGGRGLNKEEGRTYLNYLLTLSIRRDEAFGPLALAFIKEEDFDALELLPEEQFNIIMATVQAIAPEPKRYGIKMDLMQKAQSLLTKTRYSNPQLARQLDYDIKKTDAELKIYNEAMKPKRGLNQILQRLIVQTDVPDYFLHTAQKRATSYYQDKFNLSRESKTAQNFSGGPRKFEPENMKI